jgi:hypothetical protein
MSLSPDKAHLTSLDALESFRASLIFYLNKAKPSLDEVTDRVRKTRDWLQEDRLKHWKQEIHRRTKELEQAHQALFGAKMASALGAPFAQEMAFRRAKRAVAEAEEKLSHVKRWLREFDRQLGIPAKQVAGFEQFLASDMTQAIVFLDRVIAILASYSGGGSPGSAIPAESAADPEPAGPGDPSRTGGRVP